MARNAVNTLTGEILKVGDKVRRVRPNRKGFRPTAEILHFCDPDSGMVYLKFPDGNVLQSGIKQYGISYVFGEDA